MSERTGTSSRQPLVSIGLPVYNGSNYIGLAIEPILGQTLAGKLRPRPGEKICALVCGAGADGLD